MNVTVNLKEKESRNKGITLIALVITIIVLLILAGISIAMLTGDNGILNKATTAKEETEIAELIELARTEILAVQIENEGNINKNQFIEILNKFFEKETIPTKEDLPEDLSSAEQKVTAKQEYKNHKIKLSDIWNGTLQEEPLILPPFNPEELTIYNKGETKICLLSSPVQSSSIPERIPYVSPDGMIEAFCSTGDQGAIRPIVCIPTIVFNRRYLSSLS